MSFPRLIAEVHAQVNFYRAQVLHEEPWEFGRTRLSGTMEKKFTRRPVKPGESLWKLRDLNEGTK